MVKVSQKCKRRLPTDINNSKEKSKDSCQRQLLTPRERSKLNRYVMKLQVAVSGGTDMRLVKLSSKPG